MPARWFCSLALLACAAMAEAQGQWIPPDCADLPADSLEAAILDCGNAAAAPAGEHQWDQLQRSPDEVAEAAETPPERVVVNRGGAAPFGRPPAADGMPAANADGMLAVINPESIEVLDAAPETAGGAGPERPSLAGDQMEIPNGQRPPPGLCRLWFPDRPAGFQRPPTACDVEVPEGAVLVRG